MEICTILRTAHKILHYCQVCDSGSYLLVAITKRSLGRLIQPGSDGHVHEVSRRCAWLSCARRGFVPGAVPTARSFCSLGALRIRTGSGQGDPMCHAGLQGRPSLPLARARHAAPPHARGARPPRPCAQETALPRPPGGTRRGAAIWGRPKRDWQWEPEPTAKVLSLKKQMGTWFKESHFKMG